ncbi:ABC transporter permease [Herbiconiux daphne]|uniref:ABC transporter permease n=1 Tax=Herbiconiux daphne TaxID=2970914 RepID=A0ABT2H457_9MICO|nr:ABC transporter permease [Herbiconiux daphne]MCS5734724.1 ABC transporter permease [Herbiconiux daphne]
MDNSLLARFRRATHGQPVPALIALALIVVVIAAQAPVFMTAGNIANVIDQAAIPAIIVVGLSFVILMGSIDLSVEGVMAVGSMSAALLVANDRNSLDFGLWALPVVMIIGGVLGLVSGLAVTRLRIPSFLATIAIASVASGIALILFGTSAKPQIVDPVFIDLTQGTFLGFTKVSWLALVIVLLGLVIQRYTRFGRYAYVIGGSEEIAKLSGIDVRRYRLLAFVIAGMCSSLAGALTASRTSIGSTTPGDGLLFLTIASVVIGGTILTGGRGGVLHSVIGVLIMGVIVTGMVLIGVSGFYQQIIQGVVLLVAVTAVAWKLRRPMRVVM